MVCFFHWCCTQFICVLVLHMAAPALDDLIAYAKPGGTFQERTQRRDIQKLCEVSKFFLQGKAQQVVDQNANECCMVKVYGSDGTPVLANRAWKRELGSRIIRRRGKCGQEWLVERAFYKGIDEDGGADDGGVAQGSHYSF